MNTSLRQKNPNASSHRWIKHTKRQPSTPMYGRLYHYAGNNPVCYIDPDGRFERDWANGQLIAQEGDVWKDNKTLPVGERVGCVLWSISTDGTGADINAFPDVWVDDCFNACDEFGNVLQINMHNAAEQFCHFSDFFIVAGHGNEPPYKTGMFGAEGKSVIAPKLLADAIKNHPNYTPGQQILLVSCFTGRDHSEKYGINYAQALANALGKGAVVWAPAQAVIVGSDGNYEIEQNDNHVNDWQKFIGE